MSDCCASSRVSSASEILSATGLPSYAMRPGATFPDWAAVTSSRSREALLAILEAFGVERTWRDYTSTEDGVRSTLLRLYAEQGRAPAFGDLARHAGVDETAIWPILASLRARDLVVLDADGERIVGAYPFTDRDTGHRVRLGDRTLNAMCAIDALGAGAMYGRDVEIRSRCRSCDAPIMITTGEHGRAIETVDPATAIVWSGIRYADGCAASSLCTVIAFFCDDTHLQSWRAEHYPKSPGFHLSINEALEVGRAIFGQGLVGLDRQGDVAEERNVPRPPTNTPSKDTPMTGRRSGANGRNIGTYDLAIIGAGSAGFSAAITASEQGAQVALIGKGVIGGTCVNIGCVPSKALIRAAESLHNARAAARFAGITAQAEATDWRATVRQKNALVAELRQAKYTDLLPVYNGIAHREGTARLVESGVEVDGTHILAGKIIITTGARPAVPAIPGIETVPYLTSTTALELEELPKSLLVIGGGYIGAELAQLFARAGVAVTLACRSRLLPEAEPEISAALTGYFADEGITVLTGIAYRAIRKTDTGVTLTVASDGQDITLNAQKVLLAAGRTPNTEHLGLAEFGIAVSSKGGIVVDDRMRTTRAGIYAAGDVTGRDQFVYMAAYGAKIAAKNAMNGNSLSYDNSIMPAVVFTDPQVASVGLTVAEARIQGLDVKTSVLTLDNVPRALAARDTRGLIKLIAESKTGKLIGAHILAPEGSDSIQTAAMAIKAGMTYQDLASMIFPYLTTVEGLKLAAQTFDMDVNKLSCCAG